MSIRLRDALMGELDVLRFEPLDKRIRAVLGGETVIDTTSALLVWEPKRVVPTYAVPAEHVRADVSAAPEGADEHHEGVPAMGAPLGRRMVLDPSIPFSVHTTEGERLVVRGPGGATAQAFRPADPALSEHLVVGFDGFDAWFEEDEPNVGHPWDPFHRIDILHSSRHVRVELDGVVLAESTSAHLLFEPPLPVRCYLPPDDVRLDLLEPSDTRTTCAYKGHASYLARPGAGDVAWHYPAPLREAAEVAGRIAFFNERVDLFVDGEPLERPLTPWSKGSH